MAHVRDQITIAAAGRIASALGGFTITIGKMTPFGDEEFPSVNLLWEEDEFQDVGFGGEPNTEIITRAGALMVDVRDKIGGGLIFTRLNDYAVSIEPKMIKAEFDAVGTLLHEIRLNTNAFTLIGDLDKETGLLRMAYAVLYRYSSLDPSTLLP